MPWFRPSRRVEGPSGQVWEIYVTRGVGPAWKPGDYGSPSEALYGGAWLWGLLYELPMFVVTQLLWPAVRVVLTLPWVLLRSARARERTIEAIAYTPHSDYAWRAPPGDVPRVLDEIAAGLSRGTIARPDGATYLGERPDGP